MVSGAGSDPALPFIRETYRSVCNRTDYGGTVQSATALPGLVGDRSADENDGIVGTADGGFVGGSGRLFVTCVDAKNVRGRADDSNGNLKAPRLLFRLDGTERASGAGSTSGRRVLTSSCF